MASTETFVRSIRVAIVGFLLGGVVVVAGLAPTSPQVVSATGNSGTITGKVFQDFNSNGSIDTTVAIGVAVDVGVAGIVVRAFDSTGAEVGSTTTGANGTYSLSVTGAATTSVRVEFSIPTSNTSLSGFTSSFATTTGASGSTAGSAVQFVTIGDTGVNHAVNRPTEYCQNNPTLVTCSSDLGTGATTNVGAFTVPSAVNNFTDFTPTSTKIGSSRDLGSVFGIGVDRQRNTFYGTYVRRHVEYGSAGAVNAIYRINLDNPGTVTTFVTLPGTLPAHDATPVGGYGAYSGDTAIFDKVGRIGLGDVDVTPDGSTLLAVDMDEAAPKLYFVPIQGAGNAVTAGNPSSIAIPRPTSVGGVACPGTWHPMGIGARGNRILIGGTCGAENTVSPAAPRGGDPTQSTMFVLEYTGALNGSGSFSTIWGTALSYERGCVYLEYSSGRLPCDPRSSQVGGVLSADWAAWNEYPYWFRPTGESGLVGSNPQAMLANIEIADNGDLVLGLRDRFEDQLKRGLPAYSKAYVDAAYSAHVPQLAWPAPAWTSGGADLVRVCNSGSGLVFESIGTCATFAGAESDEQLTGRKEFYYDAFPAMGDWLGGTGVDGVRAHGETSGGSTASMPGYPGLWAIGYDVTGANQQGIQSFGSCAAATAGTVCRGSNTGYGSMNGGYGLGNLNGFGKGVGLNDIEVICNMAPVQVGDRLWFDTDGDGVQDPGEAPIAGVTVRLYDAAGNLVSTAVTNARGEYLFSSTVSEAANGGNTPDSSGGNLQTGKAYSIRFDNPVDYSGSGPLAGYTPSRRDSTTPAATDSENGIDSDAQVVSGYPRIDVSPLSAGGNDHSFDAGFVPKVAVGNYTWIDTDADGVQDPGESPMPGVGVELLDASGNPALDANGNPVAAQTTGPDGKYLFDNLSPGDYRIRFTPPSGWTTTAADSSSGSQATDSDANRTTGVTDVFSIAPSASGDTVADTDGSTVARFVNPTIDAGFVPKVSVGDLVWLDTDRDGVQDAGERGIAGVTLSITKADGSPVTDVFGNPVTTTTTDANGNYVFDDLPVGQYKVTVTPPTGMAPTVTGAGTSATDSSTGDATSANLATNGQSDPTLDFGFYPLKVSVGDLVWFDTDHDGVQDSGEPGLSGVTLSITNADGSPVTDVFGNPVTTTTTDANGNYVFDDLPVGQYKVTVTPPAGMEPTVTGAGTSANDSSTGDATSSNLTTDGASDMTLDFGFWAPPAVVGSRVWSDTNANGIQDPGEPGIPGVELKITKADGTRVTDVNGNRVTNLVTDADGNYVFTDLPLGTTYRVSVVRVPDGYVPSPAGQGSDRAVDSSTGSATSSKMTISNLVDLTLDFGFVPPPPPPPAPEPGGVATEVPASLPTTGRASDGWLGVMLMLLAIGAVMSRAAHRRGGLLGR
jgi:hypothetical protein